MMKLAEGAHTAIEVGGIAADQDGVSSAVASPLWDTAAGERFQLLSSLAGGDGGEDLGDTAIAHERVQDNQCLECNLGLALVQTRRQGVDDVGQSPAALEGAREERVDVLRLRRAAIRLRRRTHVLVDAARGGGARRREEKKAESASPAQSRGRLRLGFRADRGTDVRLGHGAEPGRGIWWGQGAHRRVRSHRRGWRWWRRWRWQEDPCPGGARAELAEGRLPAGAVLTSAPSPAVPAPGVCWRRPLAQDAKRRIT